jgi:tripartite-type tricarboxylate transporter receptor subunit TctC
MGGEGQVIAVRRTFGAAALALLCGCGLAAAEEWPSRPVTMVVPYAPGGNIDQAARVFGRELSEKLGQQFIVESKGGAGGSIGASMVAKSKPDGYTLLVTANGPAVLNKMLYASLPYDPDTDFTPISLISDVPQVFIVNPNSPVNDLKGLVALAKQKNTLMIGHPGVGTGAHLATLWFAKVTGINLVPVAYRGANPIVIAVLGGEIDAGFPAYIPQARSAKVIAVTSEDRVDFLPGVPTVRESGVAEISTGTFTGLAAPAGTPPEIVARINRILDAFLKTDEAKKQFALLGARTIGGPPERLTERMNREKAVWGPVVKSANIQLQ